MATTAPPSVEQVLEGAKEKFGFIPNVLTEMSKSPAALNAYIAGQQAMTGATLSPKEQVMVQLVVSTHSACEYCSAAYASIGPTVGMEKTDVDAIKNGQPASDEGLNGIVNATRLLLDKQGNLTADDLASLEGQGVTREKLYELVTLVGLKVMTNWINHIAQTPIDPQFGG